MRILLDECVSEQLPHYFEGHECQTARWAGLAGLENGELLKAAEAASLQRSFNCRSWLEYQQNLVNLQIAVVIFCGRSVLLEDLIPLIPACLEHLRSIQPGQVVRIGE